MIATSNKLIVQVEFDYQVSPYKSKRLQDPYLLRFESLKEHIISNLAPLIAIQVRPKDIPDHYVAVSKEHSNSLFIDLKKNKMVKFPRKDSFEVTMDHFVIFSKLKTGVWPVNKQIVEWIFRVAEKIADEEITTGQAQQPKQPKQLKSSKISNTYVTIKQVYQKSAQKLNMSVNSSSYRATRFPSVRESYTKQIQRFNNMPVPTQDRVRNRYVSLRQDKELIENPLPKGFNIQNIKDYNTIPYSSRYADKKMLYKKEKVSRNQATSSLNQTTNMNHTVNMNQTVNVANQPFFHWNLQKKKKSVQKKLSISKMSQNPSVQSRVTKVNKNIQLLPLIQSPNTQKRRQNGSVIEGFHEIKDAYKVQLTISDSYLNYFKNSYLIDDNYITKRSNNQNWSPILAEHLLPLRGIFYLEFTVLRSKTNHIQIGLSPASYYPKNGPNQLDDTLISYNLGNGLIKDNITNDGRLKTTWRQGGQKIQGGTSLTIVVKVNQAINKVEWFINQRLAASAKIPLQYTNGCRAFISIYHTQDLILLNSAIKEKIQQKQIKLIEEKMKLQSGIIRKNNLSGVKQQSKIQQETPKQEELSESGHNQSSPLAAIKQKIQNKKNQDAKKYHELLIDLGIVNINQGKIKKQKLIKEEPKVILQQEKQKFQEMVWFANYSSIRKKYLLFQSNPEEITQNHKKIFKPMQQPAKEQIQIPAKQQNNNVQYKINQMLQFQEKQEQRKRQQERMMRQNEENKKNEIHTFIQHLIYQSLFSQIDEPQQESKDLLEPTIVIRKISSYIQVQTQKEPQSLIKGQEGKSPVNNLTSSHHQLLEVKQEFTQEPSKIEIQNLYNSQHQQSLLNSQEKAKKKDKKCKKDVDQQKESQIVPLQWSAYYDNKIFKMRLLTAT